jgi:hypothetical protein
VVEVEVELAVTQEHKDLENVQKELLVSIGEVIRE